ncbi:glucosamine-6-phosphate deaminase [Peribacillus cavernae]|uniref:Glucosamine-6-phosphate deaminase n=1 Tax=Peribacillus cavernae TaxID=1674310 RepID=A0A433HE89_9BACI|nr:glucosamine-6-phosphate deaminase [Peribacillus cavernae]MDQ0219880.1 glucosamine-6-phosphate deaminase [Peribacillus cavernae]RUQ26635.1 glucosamine-6-phosphate deaminase [Peribacillus cavernae]
MRIIEVKDYKAMSKKAAETILEKVRTNPAIILGLATGNTPAGTYANLIEDHKTNQISYKQVTTFNLDEYIGLAGDNPNSYRYFMNDILFNHLDVEMSGTHIPRGDTKGIQEECQLYEQLIENYGGIDLQILGLGSNGHIGFNEPGTPFDSKTHIVNLTDSTRKANASFFDKQENVPFQAITMGIATIMRSKEILLLISGDKKKEAVDRLLHGDIDESFPASVLKRHPDVTIIADEAALAKARRSSHDQ